VKHEEYYSEISRELLSVTKVHNQGEEAV